MKVLIIGAVAAGASTAARLRRLDENAEIILIEKGAYFSYANCGLPYYIGGVIQDREKLFIQTEQKFFDRFRISVRVNTTATEISPDTKTVQLHNYITGESYTESYDKLVLTTGSSPIKPPIKGIDLPMIFTIRDVPDTDRLKALLQNKEIKHATVIGSGFIGMEMVENLHTLGLQVTLVERSPQILPIFDYPIVAQAQKDLMNDGVNVLLNTSVSGFELLADNQMQINFEDGQSIQTDFVILSIGVQPNAELAKKAGIAIGQFGGILVNEFMETSIADIYSAGDVIEFRNPITGIVHPTYLAGPANKQGRIIANNIINTTKSKYDGSVSTAIVKLGATTIASTGSNSIQLKRAGITFEEATVFGGSHASYYPGAETLQIRVLFSPEDGRILGGQISGKSGVDKRIDVISTLLQHQGTIYDLMEFEQAYAPPFSSAKDPLNMIGFVADNKINGLNSTFQWDEMEAIKTKALLIDIRTEKEFSEGSIDGAINIPLDSIRERLSELPKDKKLALFCKSGLRSYIGQRILMQHNYDVQNLSGGYDLWKICSDGIVKKNVVAS